MIVRVKDTDGKVHHLNTDHIVMVRTAGTSPVATVFTSIPTLLVTVDMKRRDGEDGLELARWLDS